MRRLALVLAAGSVPVCCSLATAQQVNAGYDLFQSLQGTQFMGYAFDGVPLNTFAFPNPGNSPDPIALGTGTADTIVQRKEVATPASPTVPLQMNALQLVSDTPINFGGGPLGMYYITLQSTDGTGPISAGSMTINFGTPTSGSFQSTLDVFFDVHYGSLTGPIVFNSDLILTNGGAAWSNLPAPGDLLLPNSPPNTFNHFLNGSDGLNDFFATTTSAGGTTGVPFIEAHDGGVGDHLVGDATYIGLPAQWTNGYGDHSWNTGGNWAPSGVPNWSGAVVNFNLILTGGVNLDGDKTVGKININSPFPYSINQGTGGILTIDDAGDAIVNPQINILNGNHAINAPISLAAGVSVNFSNSSSLSLSSTISGTGPISVNGHGTLTVLSPGALPAGSPLSINGGAKVFLAPTPTPSLPAVQNVASLSIDSMSTGSRLDIGNNEMIIGGATPFGTVRGYVVGGQIMSSLSDAHHGVGYLQLPLGGTGDVSNDGIVIPSTEVRYTWLGDTDLNGTISFSDLLKLAQNYNSTNAVWATGDFNYDSTVNFADLLALAQNYNAVLAPGDGGLSPDFVANWNLAQSEVSAVPEPASIALLAIGAGAVLARRRRD